MKIIKSDNFDRELYSDILIAEKVHEEYGKDIQEFLNDKFSGSTSPDYFNLVNDNYELYEMEL